MKQLFISLMLLITVSITAAEAEKHDISARDTLSGSNKHGSIALSTKSAVAGTKVMVTCTPHQGYGMSRGVYYAIVKNGVASGSIMAKCESTYPEDRANAQIFSFDMPNEDVEVWAYFTPLRTMKIHQTNGGYLVPEYGRIENNDTNLVWNVPLQPIRLTVTPNTGYELVDVDIVNVDPSYITKTSKTITVYMPNENDTVHVTPVFGKNQYDVHITGDTTQVKVQLSTKTPKPREEVAVTLLAEQGYIPANFYITGCKSWWRVDKPQLQKEDGRWKVEYRFKVDLQDVTVNVEHEQVYSFTVTDTENSGRVQTYVPELIPDYPGVARDGQKIPVVFMMPENYSVTCQANDKTGALTPQVYHNALRNSFADEGMLGWAETNDYVGAGLPMRVETDSVGNKFWCTSVKNSMSQQVSLDGRKKTGKLSVAAIASINPRKACQAEVSIVASGDQVADSKMVVADLKDQGDGWQTVFMTGEVDAKADTLTYVVTAEGDNPNKKQSYDGPMFDDLCMLLPTDGETIHNEDVLIFKIDKSNVTVNYMPSAQQNTVSVEAKDHATVTLHNVTTDEQGSSVHVMKNDVIVVRGQYDEGYAIYEMECRQEDGSDFLSLDSIDIAARKVHYHFVVRDDDMEATIIPEVGVIKVQISDNYGGLLTVNDTLAAAGTKVLVTVKPDAGCKLKQIRTIPADIVTITADDVDATTGGGKYSFVMPVTHITLIPEYVVPITNADQIDSLDNQYGEFILASDLDLGDEWDAKKIHLLGHFDGNGHRLTYSGNSSLFHTIFNCASVRHLYVSANVKGRKPYIGGIAMYNEGVIEDCEVSGKVRNTRDNSTTGAVAGQNGPHDGIISHCHVLCDVIEGATACGIAWQENCGTIRDNVFNGQFAKGDGDAYMICNDVKNSTIESNYYVSNNGNSWAVVPSGGVTAAKSVDLINLVRDMADTWPVFAASIRNKYNAYTVTTSTPEEVTLDELSASAASAGAVITGSVHVSGNNHLSSVTVSAPDGSDSRNCTFTDNTENVYYFSFTMPAHDVLVTFKTAVGTLIYTAKQFAAVNDKKGTFILARDLHLSNWDKKVSLKGNFQGNGHTIRYDDASGTFTGLFYKIKKNALLEGLRVVGNVESEMNCGGIATENYGTIRNCHFCGRISGKSIHSTNRVSAITYKMVGKASLLDHCSATGELISPDNQDAVNEHPLCAQGDGNITDSYWVSSTRKDQYGEQLQAANAALNDYPVYAQGIIDKITPRVIVGSNTIHVQNDETLDELILIDGEPFVCTADVKVKRIVYKRQSTNALEQWVLPFAFDRIAGNGMFEYHKTIEEDKMPNIERPGKTLTLTNAPLAVAYKANEPWLIKGDGSEYVFTNSDGPITVKATYNNPIARYASVMDIGSIYATYDNIPAATAQEELLYVWDSGKQTFECAAPAPVDILPYRFYLQFFDKGSKEVVKYTQTGWGKDEEQSSGKIAPRRLAEAMTDGWQPIFLDPRQPQSVTARMLDNYEVAYLVDINGETFDEDTDTPLSVVSLVYKMVDHRMDLPAAIPLLVRAKRADAELLVDEKTGAEIDSLYMLSLLSMIDEDYNDNEEDNGEHQSSEDEEDDLPDFEMPHYWCASFGNRLDIWPLPSSEKYADLAEYGCMMFDDNYYNQSFLYADAFATPHSQRENDSRTTSPMSYCITVLNVNTYELLPLLGDRVNVEFIGTGGTTSLTPSPSPKGEGSGYTYNLHGQRVSASYKGIILQYGRKVIKR